MQSQILSEDFFNASTVEVAQSLLGKLLVHQTEQGCLVGKIVETEAYLKDDPAAHTYKGKTKRNRAMFGPPGCAYIYFIYGMYYCLNCTTNVDGIGEGVLIRALEPIIGIDLMKKYRKVHHEKDLCSGPGKLTIAMGISMTDYGLSFIKQSSKLRIEAALNQEDFEIVKTNRVGLSVAKEVPHRFYIKGNTFISKK